MSDTSERRQRVRGRKRSRGQKKSKQLWEGSERMKRRAEEEKEREGESLVLNGENGARPIAPWRPISLSVSAGGG